jgi:CelD/BcsL family acetyltransferase involved in cellulose biosynthesis
MAVATLPPAKQKEMLEQARIGHWNRKMLRDTVAGKVSPPGEPRHTEEPPVELPDEDRRLKFDDVREARKFFASLYDRLPSQEEIESCKDLLVVEAWLEMTLNFGNLINVLENRQRELFEAAEKKARKDRREQHRKEPPSPVGAVKESKASIAERAKKTMTECLDRAADAREAELAAQAAAPPEVPVLNDGTVVDIACKKCGKLWHATLGVRQRCPHCSSSHAAGVIRSLARTAQVVAPADAAKEPAPAAATVAGKWATEAEIDEVFKKNFTKIDLNQPSEGPK